MQNSHELNIEAPYQAVEGPHSVMQVLSLKIRLCCCHSKSVSGLVCTSKLEHEAVITCPSEAWCD